MLFIFNGTTRRGRNIERGRREYFLMRSARAKWSVVSPSNCIVPIRTTFVTRNLFRTEIPLANTPTHTGNRIFSLSWFFFAFSFLLFFFNFWLSPFVPATRARTELQFDYESTWHAVCTESRTVFTRAACWFEHARSKKVSPSSPYLSDSSMFVNR